MTSIPPPEHFYVAIADVKPLPDPSDWTSADKNNHRIFYKQRGASSIYDHNTVFETLEDANNFAKFCLRSVYRRKEGPNFTPDRWINDESNTIMYKDGCLTMDKFPKEGKVSRLAYPYKISVQKFPYISSLAKKALENNAQLSAPKRQADKISAPPSKRIKTANLATQPTKTISRTITVYKLVSTKKHTGADKHNDENETSVSREKYYLNLKNALEAFLAEGVEYDDKGMPSRNMDLDIRVEPSEVQVSFYKEKGGSENEVEANKEDVRFEDWDGTSSGWNKLLKD